MMKKIKDIYHDAYWELQETSYAEVQTNSKTETKRSRRKANTTHFK